MPRPPQLVIKKFACFDYVEIDVNAFCVLIGPQASGKSLAVKLIYYFQSVCSDFVELSLDAESKPSLLRTLQERFSRYFPPSTCGSREFEIEFRLGEERICVVGQKRKNKSKQPISIKVSYSAFFAKVYVDSRIHLGWTMNRVATGKEDDYKIFEQRWNRRREAIQALSEKTGCRIPSRQIFIPAGRSFFALLDKNIYRFLQGANSLDPFFGLFGASYDAARTRRTSGGKQSESDPGEVILPCFDELVKKILRGNMIQRREKTFLVVDHDREIPLEIGSSGQQEAVPMVIVLRHALWNILRTSNNSESDADSPMIFFEEPEAHLFPMAQKDIVDLLVLVFVASLGRARFIITTHSPYVLAAINVAIQRANNPSLMDCGSLDRIGSLLKQHKRLPLSWSALSAFSVDAGSITSILEEDGTLIDAKIIDQASDAIYEEMESNAR